METGPSKLAKYEIGWWKAHPRKDSEALTENMARLYQLQFGLSEKEALDCVHYRILAAKEHDLAEEIEDEGRKNESGLHWKKAEELLERHFEVLQRTRARTQS